MPTSSAPSTGPVAPAALLRRAADAVLYSSTWLALAALGLTWATFLAWQVAMLPRLGLLIFAATLFLYNIDSVLPYKFRQQQQLSGRKRWMLAHRRSMLVLALGALAVAGGLFLADGWQRLTWFLSHLTAISLLYSLPLLQWRGRWWALRDLPLLKVFLIAYVWAAVTVWVPALALGREPAAPPVLLVFAQRFLFILALAFVFDIRDYTKDRLMGTRTFPGVFGVQATKYVALAALVLANLLPPVPPSVAQLVVLSAPSVAGAALIWHAHESRPDYYFALFTDGVMLLQFLAVYVAAGL
ncbi:UbiA family prenyltransferase [Hymenobacter canadensis]|uniref:UbiA family prenyltransferase n=1 Tax=Hymenobacter canadensis TaxID=2999067 RepID=A0ABY7LRF9_9BACT|nr:UbiA family prenyltransferase [Hymenobacter canadensis]WBA41483.1 UbiA family prenyltransferase [Hymenobacter canadensis]